jgi:heme-degrading monooxygenase HmoA
MVIAIFRSRVRPEHEAEAAPMKARIAEIAKSMPGYLTHKGYVAEDGERVSIHYWESEEQLRAFRDHPEHREIQKFGRDKLYEGYSLYVCEVIRDAKFPSKKG